MRLRDRLKKPLLLFFLIIGAWLLLRVTAITIQKLGLSPIPATVEFVIPDRNQYRLHEIFPMKIHLTNLETPINVVQADLSYDPKRLEVVDITTDGSFAKIFLQKEFDNKLGYMRITGGLPNPGYTEKAGRFATIFFRGISPGLAEVKFLESSLVLANDGKGTNVLEDVATAAYMILPESIPDNDRKEQDNITIIQGQGGSTALEFYNETQNLPLPPESETELKQGEESVTAIVIKFITQLDAAILRLVKR